MTAPGKEISLDIFAGGVPDLSKPATAAKFAEMASTGNLDRLTPGQQAVFLAGLGAYIGVKPELGDLMIYEGRPYITIGGYRRIAHNTGLLNGIVAEPASDRDFARFGAKPNEYLWVARVHKKGSARPYVGWGYIRESELKMKQGRNGPYEPVTLAKSQEMAKKRAIYDGLRLAFPPMEVIGNLHTTYISEAEAASVRAHPIAALAESDYTEGAVSSEVHADDEVPRVEEVPEVEFQDDRDLDD